MRTYSDTKLSAHEGIDSEDESLFKDGNGFVSTSEIKFVLSRLGVEFSDEELGEMVRKLHQSLASTADKRYMRLRIYLVSAEEDWRD